MLAPYGSRLIRLFRLAPLVICLLLAALRPAAAQQAEEPETRAGQISALRSQKQAQLTREEPSKLERQLLILKEKQVLQRFGKPVSGFFPVFGGIGTGQGLALGVQYLKKNIAEGAVQFRTSVRGSLALSNKYDIELLFPKIADGKIEADLLAVHRDLTQVDFYGLGPESNVEDRTSFRQEDTDFRGGLAYKPFGNWLRLGFSGGYLFMNTGPGQRANTPSTEEFFSPAVVAGLDQQTDFLYGGPILEFDYRDVPGGARSGGYYTARYLYYDDRVLGRHDFRRLDLEAEQYIPFFNKRRVFALRALSQLNFTNGASRVPFYLKPWAGGPYTMRGFRNYRFYGDNTLILNAEYRWEAFSGLDMALFFDAGQVREDRDFELDELETSAGFGFRFNVRNQTFLRLDFGFSHEGMQIWFRFGDPF